MTGPRRYEPSDDALRAAAQVYDEKYRARHNLLGCVGVTFIFLYCVALLALMFLAGRWLWLNA